MRHHTPLIPALEAESGRSLRRSQSEESNTILEREKKKNRKEKKGKDEWMDGHIFQPS